MNRRAGPPSQLPTLTEVVGDAAPPPGFVASTSGSRLLDEAHRDPAPGLVGKDAAGITAPAGAEGAAVRAGTGQPGAAAPSAADGAASGVPPSRQALTRKPRSPLLGAALPASAGSQLPLLAAHVEAPPSAVQTAAAGSVEPGLGADIFDNAGQPTGESGDDQLVRAVLQDLQRHVDLMLEYRLRASLTPVLTQMADNLVRELRQELAGTLRDVVKRAVSQELVRRRKR